MENLFLIVSLISIFMLIIYIMYEVLIDFFKWFRRNINLFNPLKWDWTIYNRLDKDDELFNV